MPTNARARHDPTKSLVGFVVGDVRYAVPISRVREITNPLDVVALPHAPHSVIGVADYRGDVVPVVDLRARFGLGASPATRRTKWIVVDVAARFVALVVDAVTEVFGTGGADLRAPPSLAGGDDVRGIIGVTSHQDELVFVLDTMRLRDLIDRVADSMAPLAIGARAPKLPGAP